MLATLLPQVQSFTSSVEVVVSDNCSTDDTAQVADEVGAAFPFRYHRNANNIGAEPNFHRCVNDLAQGKYVWLLGDDDFVRPGGVQAVLEVLTKNPDLEYVYMNYSTWYADAPPTSSADLPEPNSDSIGSSDLSNHRVERLMDIVGDDSNCFTPISCSIMRRELLSQAIYRDPALEQFSTVESVVPVACWIAKNYLNKPAWYMGTPYTVLAMGSTWEKYHPAFSLTILPALYDRLDAAGVSRLKTDRLRYLNARYTRPSMHRMLRLKDTPHRDKFSVTRYLWQHRRVPRACKVVIDGYFDRDLLQEMRGRLGMMKRRVLGRSDDGEQFRPIAKETR